MEYYVCIYLNPLKPGNYNFKKFHFDYEPFYIGLGKNKRMDCHLYEAKYNKMKSFKDNIILEILKNNIEPIRYKLYENITFYTSKRLEKYLIKLIGRRDLKKGTLVNLTDGGEGSINYIQSEKSISKMIKTIGDSRKGELNSNYGKIWSKEQKEKASLINKENHKHLCGDNNPSKRIDIRKKISETKMGLKNPNACIWELITPDNEIIKVEGGIKRTLKEYDLTYQKMKYKIIDGIYYSKNGWKMYKIFV